ncbi:unnamed protein product [Trichobilharzia regenti]|nr:unnamed protein product [Trichobilharzia regenti]
MLCTAKASAIQNRRIRVPFGKLCRTLQIILNDALDFACVNIALHAFLFFFLLDIKTHQHHQQQQKELAFRRANEILVRASRDLEWSVKTLQAETNFYNSLNTKSFSNDNEDVYRAGKTKDGVQIPISEKNGSAGKAFQIMCITSNGKDTQGWSLFCFCFLLSTFQAQFTFQITVL